ncbi:MAG TPA: DNA mismatch repair endonuclease MutL [Candidatus Acidoferrum sp.]|nr:DNA mismatch repair endonuclease MutL [Candidatus Acidoferrum sp.]
MNRIRLLPEHVANQIAAGEVVERPASVVKELVENSLDANPTRITVEIQAGGRSLIRVTDDGIGMSRDDALLCLERHATSKIQRAEDLQGIATMGFRGEALPSIASVSRFTLTTRERDSDSPEGTQVIINGGKIIEVKAAGSAPGTGLEVRSLFFNLPARRKFLRSEETESAHIQHYLTLAALAHADVAFTFVKDGRTVWQLPGVKTTAAPDAGINALRERMRQLAGTLPQLITVDTSGPLHERLAEDESNQSSIRLWGLIGAPGVSRGTREDQRLFVNRRPVENRTLNHALFEGYHTALMKGRFPVCCLFIEIDPAAVDVNIHPSKREVKFRDERAVRGFVANAVRDALLSFHSASAGPQLAPAPQRSPETTPQNRSQPIPAPELRLPNVPALPNATPQFPGTAPLPLTFRRDVDATPRPSASPTISNPQSSILNPQSPHAPTPLLAVSLRILGVIGKLYVVLESDRGLVLLDQHAAHERILFEQMMDRTERSQVASQRLLLPETIELSPRDATFVRGILATLVRLGVGLSEFGERTFLLDALPPFVKSTEPRGFVLGLVDELKAAGEEVNSMRLGELVVAKTVCRHAVKANDPLAGPELENLVNDLRRCAMPYTCPHGRPTLIEMNFRELEKKFGRTQ